MRAVPMMWALRGKAQMSRAPAASQMRRISLSAWSVMRRSFSPMVKCTRGFGSPRASSSSDSST